MLVVRRRAAPVRRHPVPYGLSRTTLQRSDLAGFAGYGHCASHSRWYWGLKLYLLTTTDGLPVTWCLANPKLGEREVAQELLAHAHEAGALQPGMVVITDKGLPGRDMERFCADQVGVLLVRPDRKDEKRRFGNLAGIRRWIESVNDTRKGQLDLEGHGGRTTAGVYTASPTASSRWPPRSGTTDPSTPRTSGP